MIKNKIYIVFILILITLNYNVLAQSKFEIDTSLAIKYTDQIKNIRNEVTTLLQFT